MLGRLKKSAKATKATKGWAMIQSSLSVFRSQTLNQCIILSSAPLNIFFWGLVIPIDLLDYQQMSGNSKT